MESSSVAVRVIDVEHRNEMRSISSSPSPPPPCLRLRRFDERVTKHFRESQHQHECKQRLLKKELQRGFSCRSLDNNDDDALDGSGFESTITTTTTTRSKTTWFRRSSNNSRDGGGPRRVIHRHYSLQEWMMNRHHYPSAGNLEPEETVTLDSTASISEPGETGMVGSQNSVFSVSIGRRAKKQQIPQSSTPGNHGQVDDSSNTDDEDDDDHSSIDPEMPILTHTVYDNRFMASSSSSPPPAMKYYPTTQQQLLLKKQQQHQRPPVLQCLFGRRDAAPPTLTSPTDSNITTSDSDDEDDEDDDELAFWPTIPLIVDDESSHSAAPPPPPPMVVDRWSPSPPTVKMLAFGSSSSEEPPKLPTRRGNDDDELLSCCSLSPPRLPTRSRPQMEDNQVSTMVNSNTTTGTIIPTPPPPPLVCNFPRHNGCSSLSKPIPRTAATASTRGTCIKVLCDNGGIVANSHQQVTGPTAPYRLMNGASCKEDEDTDADYVVLPLNNGILNEFTPPSTTPHSHGECFRNIQKQEKNSVLVKTTPRGILKGNSSVAIRDHMGKSSMIREGTAFLHSSGDGRNHLRGGDETKKQNTKERNNNKNNNVTFGRIHIREYERILGDNPSCSCGPPISLGWLYWDLYDSTLDDYEFSCQKSTPSSASSSSSQVKQRGGGKKRDLYLSPLRRCELILHEWQFQEEEEEEEVRRAPSYEETALVPTSMAARGRGKSSNSRLQHTSDVVAAFLSKPSVDDSDTSQPLQEGGSLITTTMKEQQQHATLGDDDESV